MKMKFIRYTTLPLLTAALILAGCATPVGSVKFPGPSEGFAPKQTYAVPQDKLWNAALSALDKHRIPAVSADKASGIIQTDAIEGPSALIALGMVAAQSTRYRFNLALRNQSDTDIKLNIFCKIESTMKGSSGSSQWTDVTSQNAEQARKLEAWLYEEIEKGL
ncbi:MAG: outer membrane protein assembly factor BamC [Verrucomicrobia bacterium]|nr:outer membrane protein assembly factor BamC [Verrucomicrobiota bacterium]